MIDSTPSRHSRTQSEHNIYVNPDTNVKLRVRAHDNDFLGLVAQLAKGKDPSSVPIEKYDAVVKENQQLREENRILKLGQQLTQTPVAAATTHQPTLQRKRCARLITCTKITATIAVLAGCALQYYGFSPSKLFENTRSTSLLELASFAFPNFNISNPLCL